mgnify:FL=1
MDPQLEAFLALVADDVELQQLLTAPDADVVALAKGRGITLDASRLQVHRQAWQEQYKTMLLSDNQLETVVGGAAGAADEVICIDITCRQTVWWYA